MTNPDLIYQIGITLVRGIGNIIGKQVIDALGGDVSLLFREKKRLLEKIPGISRRILEDVNNPEVLKRAEKEILFIEKHRIRPLFIAGEDYPLRLRECVDSPVMLYYRGEANLNAEKIISIVGTRSATAYGREITDRLVREISETFPETLIVSGLALGIDVCAHRASLKDDMATVGVLAHGLDRIYPPSHTNVAKEMLKRGGLITDFISETTPDRQNFVKRNRIIAGLADCTVVVESAAKGGALITANIADSYNRDVFAFPGRVGDKCSEGCNLLLRHRKAALITSAADIFEEMNWTAKSENAKKEVQRTILLDLKPDEQQIVDLLAKAENMQLNVLAIELNWPVSKLSSTLFELEMNGTVRCKPGGMYSLA
jgi:DNA processing protein